MLKIITILFKAGVHSLFNFKNILYNPFVNTLDSLFNFMLQQELLTAEEILSKIFDTSLDTEGLPGDFSLSTPSVQTNLLIISLM